MSFVRHPEMMKLRAMYNKAVRLLIAHASSNLTALRYIFYSARRQQPNRLLYIGDLR